jgi:hypothetical protein
LANKLVIIEHKSKTKFLLVKNFQDQYEVVSSVLK